VARASRRVTHSARRSLKYEKGLPGWRLLGFVWFGREMGNGVFMGESFFVSVIDKYSWGIHGVFMGDGEWGIHGGMGYSWGNPFL
jgi:hypothetical protein